VAGACEYNNEISGSIKGEEFHQEVFCAMEFYTPKITILKNSRGTPMARIPIFIRAHIHAYMNQKRKLRPMLLKEPFGYFHVIT
jgi:hypothetical protein